MIIVDAKWDERNFGFRCAEVEMELDDDVTEFERRVKELDNEFSYIALKIPTERVDAIWNIHKLGYTYVEDMMFLEHDLHEIVRTPLQQRLYDAVKIEEMDTDDFDILFSEIDSGSFAFDRISNDPYFSLDMSVVRFHNWLNDERTRGAIFLKGVMKGEMIGFFTIREIEPRVWTSALGGIFSKWRRGGLGTNIQTPEEVKKRGGKRLVLGVSTNNMIQIRALVQNGFLPRRANHVYTKHTDI